MKTFLEIDGSASGGQTLRTGLALSLVTGRPARFLHIRGQRAKPGLMRQHLTCVHAASAIGAAKTDGVALGSTEITFAPTEAPRPDAYEWAIGTAGSTTLLAQCLLPALWSAERPSVLVLRGGTHNSMAPPFDFFHRSFLGALAVMGVPVEANLEKIGFSPAGGGRIRIEMPGKAKPKAIRWEQPEPVGRKRLRVLTRNVPSGVGSRVAKAAQDASGWPDSTVVLDQDPSEETQSSGVCAMMEVETGGRWEMSSVLGERRLSSEVVGARVARGMGHFLASGAVVGRFLADQLILPMALGEGGSFVTMAPTDHLRTHALLIERFDIARVAIEEWKPKTGLWRVVVHPRSLGNS